MTGSPGGTIAVVQARTSSTRLPGKVLLSLAGSPMILRQLERISRATTLDSIVVATSLDPSDDDLSRCVEDSGFAVIRGPLDDVLSRYVLAIERFQPEFVVRLTGDCPLTCPEIIDMVVERAHSTRVDYVSNTLEPTFPDGLDVEVVSPVALGQVASETTDRDEREHVTLGVYRNPDRFSLLNVEDPGGRNHADLRWTVDDLDDFSLVSSVYELLYPSKPDFGYADILELLSRESQISLLNKGKPRNEALNGLDTGALRHVFDA